MTTVQVGPITARVLIVDDDDDFRRSTAHVLSSQGYVCLEASSGAEALAVLRDGPIVGAALCDVTMPGMSGIELLAELAAEYPDLAVVMTTGSDDPSLANQAFSLGAFGYVIKPFEPNDLLINLTSALRRRDLDSARRNRVRELESALAHYAAEPVWPSVGEATGRIRILVVDDHAIFAHSLVRLLGTVASLTVVGTADSVSTAVAAAVALKPDVVLMDFELPDGSGSDATEQIKSLMPSTQVIMLTAHHDDEVLVRAIASGCSGFVEKSDAVEKLVDTITAAYDGEPAIPAAGLVPLFRQLPPTKRGLGSDLTPRELEVLELMAAGLINKHIARRLGLRLNTVRNHSQNILFKLHAHSRLEAVAIAVRDGIIAYPSETPDM